MDTICALSTPYGKSAIAVIRLSGPSSVNIVNKMFGQKLSHRQSAPGILRALDGRALDEVVVTLFEAPNSYTGEDVVEIACHGNPKIVEEILGQIVSRETRLAEPGEFTRRALANQKMSVDQVEALDIILNSSTSAGIQTGLRAKTKGLGHSVVELSDLLMDLRVQVESQLDFSEAEVGFYDPQKIVSAIESLIKRLHVWAEAYEKHRHLFGRWVVALVGRPNSGKSSLFNALIGSNKAIVYDEAGTTRDYLTQELEILGTPTTLIDTAGIRETPDPVEGLGIAKTLEVMKQAEVICWVDGDGVMPDDKLRSEFSDKIWILVRSKADLLSNPALVAAPILAVSSKTGDGVGELRARLVPKSETILQDDSSWAPLTSKRQHTQVVSGIQHLRAAVDHLGKGGFLDMAAHEINLALQCIEGLVDRVPAESVIHSIFSRFCIGK